MLKPLSLAIVMTPRSIPEPQPSTLTQPHLRGSQPQCSASYTMLTTSASQPRPYTSRPIVRNNSIMARNLKEPDGVGTLGTDPTNSVYKKTQNSHICSTDTSTNLFIQSVNAFPVLTNNRHLGPTQSWLTHLCLLDILPV